MEGFGKLDMGDQLTSQQAPKKFYQTRLFLLIVAAIFLILLIIIIIAVSSKNSSKNDSSPKKDDDTPEPIEPTVTNFTKKVSTAAELYQAIYSAVPGDIIGILPGTYDYTTYDQAQKFYTEKSGNKTSPIILTATDPENPPLLLGTNTENGYVLHIVGSYWIIDNIKFSTSQKGIVLDKSQYSIIKNCEIFNTGSEALAIRDGSSYNTVKNCYIHDTGKNNPGFGEGVYIGSSVTTTGYDYYCNYNVVNNCTFKNVAAEHVDVKEYTTGTEIANCLFYGDGMTGENYAGSFIDIAGKDVYVHDNIGHRNNNKKIVAAFEMHDQVTGWATNATFVNNVLYMDRSYGEEDTSRRMYVVDAWDLKFSVKNNKVDYGNGLVDAKSWEYYNSDYVTYLE